MRSAPYGSPRLLGSQELSGSRLRFVRRGTFREQHSTISIKGKNMATSAPQLTEKDMEKLMNKSEEALFEELGLRSEDRKNVGGYARAQAFAGTFPQDGEDQLGMDDLRKIGRKFWSKLEPQLIELICTNNPELGKITGGKSLAQVASSLATAG